MKETNDLKEGVEGYLSIKEGRHRCKGQTKEGVSSCFEYRKRKKKVIAREKRIRIKVLNEGFLGKEEGRKRCKGQRKRRRV